METSDYEGSTLESEIDLYDSDRLALNKVINTLAQAVGTLRSLEGYRQEIMDRFFEAGFLTDVRVFEAEVEGTGDKVFHFKVVLTGRAEKEEEFDHERQAHEVQSDLLGGGKNSVRGTSVSMAGAFSRTDSGLFVPGQ